MSEWSGQSRGSVLGYKIFVLFIRYFGLPAAYVLLRIVSFYYYLFAKRHKKPLLSFYTTGLGFTPAKARKLCRENFYLIGQSLVDRVAFLVNRGEKLTYNLNGDHFLRQIAKDNRGGILISAHLGNWEIAGNLLKEFQNPINAVMLDAEHEQIKNYLKDVTGGPRFKVIPIRQDLSHIFHIREALEAGEFVCMHADRYLPGTRTITLNFFNKPARFSFGPFHIASKFNSPVTFVFSVKDSAYHYRLSATQPMAGLQKPEVYAEAFAKVLEDKVRGNPEQWFNYHDFFKLDDE